MQRCSNEARPASLVLSLSFLSLFSGAAFAQMLATVNPSPDLNPSNELAGVRAEYVAAVNSADPARAGALYATDAALVEPDGVTLRGRADIEEYFRKAFASSSEHARVAITPLQAVAAGDLASETGAYEESDRLPSGETVTSTGIYVVIYSREPDGRWRIAMEIRTSGQQAAVLRW